MKASSRDELALVPTPQATATHKPIPHIEVVRGLIETFGFRQIAVVGDESAVSRDGMKMFGVMELDQGMQGAQFALGIRNSHDKSFRLAVTVGCRVFICENLAFSGDFSPIFAKHSKNFSLSNTLSIGVDDMQRNFKADGRRGGSLEGLAALPTRTHGPHLPSLHRSRARRAPAPGALSPVFGINRESRSD